MQAICDNAPRLIDHLGEASRRHYDDWRAMLQAVGIDYVENPRLVRGLDYYNLSVFEWVTTELGAQGTVCGGGRYDSLIEQLGGKPAPAVGFAMGVERLMLLLQDKALLPAAPAPDVYLVNQGEGAALYALTVAQALRAAGLKVIQHCGEASFKSQFKKADASGAAVAVVLGDNEVAQQQAVVKPLRGGGEQTTVARAELAAAVAAHLNR